MTQTQPAPQRPTEQARRREHTWSDPAPGIARLPDLAGIDVLRGMLDGALPAPPVMSTLGFEAEEFEVGRVVFSMLPQEFHLNPLGGVHGGVLATLLDSAIGCAVHSALPQGVGYTSVDLNTTFTRPVTVGTGRITATGTVLNLGRRTALGQAQLTDSTGRLLAHATSTCLLFPATG